jgi:multiple sugar transport system substrate-binding protein
MTGVTDGGRVGRSQAGGTRRRFLGRGATLGALGVGGAACAATGPGPASGGPRGLKTGVTLGWHSNSAGRIYEVRSETARAFEARHPGITVEVVNSNATKVLALFAAGTPPDVFSSEPGLMLGYVSRRQIAPLDPLLKRDRYDLADYFPKVLDQFRWAGKLWALPWMGLRALFYNVDAFAQAGVPRPPGDWKAPGWTFGAFEAALPRLARPTAAGDAFGYTVPRDYRDWNAWVYSNGGELWNRDRTQCALTEPRATEALQFLADIIHRLRAGPTAAQLSEIGGAVNGFATGRAASTWIVVGNLWTIRSTVGTTFRWSVAPTPRGNAGGEPALSGGGQGWYLTAGLPNQNETWELMQWFSAAEASGREVEAGTTVPFRKSVAQQPYWADLAPPEQMRLLVQGMEYLRVDAHFTTWTDIQTAMGEELAPLWQGAETARTVTARLKQRVDPLLQEAARAAETAGR